MTTTDAPSFVAQPVQHYASGASVRRVTYRGAVEDTDGKTVWHCGHMGHKTSDAALWCASKTYPAQELIRRHQETL